MLHSDISVATPGRGVPSSPKHQNILGMKTQPQNYSGIGTEDISTLEHSFSTSDHKILTKRLDFQPLKLGINNILIMKLVHFAMEASIPEHLSKPGREISNFSYC